MSRVLGAWMAREAAASAEYETERTAFLKLEAPGFAALFTGFRPQLVAADAGMAVDQKDSGIAT